MVIALIDVAHDKKQEVRDDISRTLYELGKRQPFLVLSSCNSYLNKHQKVCICFYLFMVNQSVEWV